MGGKTPGVINVFIPRAGGMSFFNYRFCQLFIPVQGPPEKHPQNMNFKGKLGPNYITEYVFKMTKNMQI